jgi:hypothetical protein
MPGESTMSRIVQIFSTLPPGAEYLARYIASRHPWYSTNHARDHIRADMDIIRPFVGACSEEGLALRAAIRVASRLFPDDQPPVEIPACSKLSERS